MPTPLPCHEQCNRYIHHMSVHNPVDDTDMLFTFQQAFNLTAEIPNTVVAQNEDTGYLHLST
jgi:hypothetical protein